MRSLFLYGTAGGFFILSATFLPAQCTDSTACQHACHAAAQDSSAQKNKKCWLWRDAQVSGGQLTLPFKIRKNAENHTFKLTTDVTLGGYIGYTRSLSAKKDFSITIPLTAGLTFINLNNSNATLARLEESDAEVVPGLTWSSGVIMQLQQFNFGILFGKDYAAEVGNQWEYHGKLWWSFGIGFVFLQ